MNWRKEIKDYFSTSILSVLGDSVKKFAPWNDQLTNYLNEETLPPLTIFFEYSLIGDGSEYLLQQHTREAERVPVTVTLHICFSAFTDDSQNFAYEYAELITEALEGLKHELIHGRILKTGEFEDINRAAPYDYQMQFSFWVKEAVFRSLEDANPETETDPNPATGRRLKTSITVDYQ